MPTNYPTGLDNFTNPSATDSQNSPSHAGQHSNANDAIEAIEAELGINPSGTYADLVTRLAAGGLRTGSTRVAAASNSDSESKASADAVCDGVADNIELQALIDALPTGGGVLALLPGNYTLATGLTITTNKHIQIVGFGAKVLLPASVTGLTINQGISNTRGVSVYGLVIDGQNNTGTIGVAFTDTNWSGLYGVQIENCERSILMHSATTNNFVEGISLIDVVSRNSSIYGIEYRRTGGTNSFGQHSYKNVSINVGAGTGVYVASGCSLYRSRLEIGCWIGSNETGFNFDGDFDQTVMDLFVEGATGSTGNTAITIGTNATNLDRAVSHFSFWGTITTQISNAFSKDFWFKSGRHFKGGHDNSTAPLRVTSDNGSGDFFVVGLNGVAGGRVYWGNGTGTLDSYIERNAALKLLTNAKFDPASFNSQTKAGTPVDGDIVGGAADGDIVVDTTASKIWVRIGGTWKSVALT